MFQEQTFSEDFCAILGCYLLICLIYQKLGPDWVSSTFKQSRKYGYLGCSLSFKIGIAN